MFACEIQVFVLLSVFPSCQKVFQNVHHHMQKLMLHHHVPQVKFLGTQFSNRPIFYKNQSECGPNLWLFKKLTPWLLAQGIPTSLAGDVEELRAERLLLAGLLASATLVLPKTRLSTVRP